MAPQNFLGIPRLSLHNCWKPEDVILDEQHVHGCNILTRGEVPSPGRQSPVPSHVRCSSRRGRTARGEAWAHQGPSGLAGGQGLVWWAGCHPGSHGATSPCWKPAASAQNLLTAGLGTCGTGQGRHKNPDRRSAGFPGQCWLSHPLLKLQFPQR